MNAKALLIFQVAFRLNTSNNICIPQKKSSCFINSPNIGMSPKFTLLEWKHNYFTLHSFDDELRRSLISPPPSPLLQLLSSSSPSFLPFSLSPFLSSNLLVPYHPWFSSPISCICFLFSQKIYRTW